MRLSSSVLSVFCLLTNAKRLCKPYWLVIATVCSITFPQATLNPPNNRRTMLI
ncbi:hypothetical protein PNIG_a2398 [Pseudoalteromonas nigrifaciens]|uniref:Uncharacterized protein n=1 Tax=Pseudoalteromonas nigrifaciens TaxID=28109 RepID=A0AAC9UIM4_9GAMM|nr:hypothetical protein PNIG_a2398 [Pseudoalteromonas nigrifaciens]